MKKTKISVTALSVALSCLLTACSVAEDYESGGSGIDITESSTITSTKEENTEGSASESISETSTPEVSITTAELTSDTEKISTETTTEKIPETSANTSVPINTTVETQTETVPETTTKVPTTETETTEAPVSISETTAPETVSDTAAAEAYTNAVITPDKPFPLNWENLAPNNGVEIELTTDEAEYWNQTASGDYMSQASDTGGRPSIMYEGVEYIFAHNYGEYLIYDDKTVLDLYAWYDDWKLSTEYNLDALLMKFEQFEYIGRVKGKEVWLSDDYGTHMYLCEDNLILVEPNDSILLFTWDVRKKLFGLTDEENLRIGNDPDILREVVAEHGINYDPSMFLLISLYEKR